MNELQAGDRVVYAQRHHEWLAMAGKWPSKFVPRVAVRGTVQSAEQTVTVKWDSGPVTQHFPDNLEASPSLII